MNIRTLGFATVLTAVLALLPASASAETVVRRDARNDAPAGIDITRVAYAYSARRVAATVRVPELARTGRMGLSISRFEVFEAGYVAIVRRSSDGTVSARLLYFDHFDATPRPCDVDGTWSRDAGVITVSVPVGCLDGHRRQRIYTAARTLRRDLIDDAPVVRRLSRG
jgi:hypothetical protein